MLFPQSLAGVRRIHGGWQQSGWLWCCGRPCWWCSRRMTKRSRPVGSGRGRRGPVREGYKVVALLLKPSLLWTSGPAPSPAASPRFCHRPPDFTRRLPHSSAQLGTLWCWLLSRVRRCEVAWCDPHLKPHQRP